jgi:hypothetical protein
MREEPSGRFMEIEMNIPAYGVLESALILGKHYNPEM